jgi:multicomponent Na+:H+ antiporter subunit G
MMLDLIGFGLISLGVAFFAAGSIGLLRLPDLHCRLHALTKADNLGLGLLCAGLALLNGGVVNALKLFLVWLLVLAASAASAHMIAHQALRKADK